MPVGHPVDTAEGISKNNYQKLARYGKTYASFLPPNSLAAHRGPGGKSKGKGKSSKQNPKDKNGVVMKCHRCGSSEHLIRKCPQADNAGQFQAVSIATHPLADVTGSNASVPSNLQFYARGHHVTICHPKFCSR